MSEKAYNIWGVVAGVIGTIAVLIPLAIACCCVRRPSTLYPLLAALLKETRGLLDTAYREGLTKDEAELCRLKVNIWQSFTEVEELCAAVYAKDTLWYNLNNWQKGLSRKISTAYEELNSHRVTLATHCVLIQELTRSKTPFLAIVAMHDHKGECYCSRQCSDLTATTHRECALRSSTSRRHHRTRDSAWYR
ncbi:hypothetical protein BD413DRAFT_575153 [Trametes elegans]|nr:hypothetical protein BD413DRAFT_575153 [Trametes elegans]